MKTTLVPYAALAGLLFIAPAQAAVATMEWDAVTQNADGTGITDLAGYRIFRSAASLLNKTTQQAMADASIIKTVVNAPATSLTVNLAPGTYFFRATAFDTAGNQSGFNVNLSGADTEISTTIAQAPLTGPIGHWKLDEVSGLSAADSSGSGLTGTLAGSPAWGAGRVGGALSFDGVDDSVNVPAASVLTVGPAFTLSAWVNPSAAMSTFKAVMVKNYSYYLYGSVQGYCGSGAVLVGFAGGSAPACDPTPLPVNAWTHLAATYDGATLRIFRNGVQTVSQAASGTPQTTTGGLQIAASQFGEFFPGKIDDARVYNRALGVSEIQALANPPAPPAEALYSLWDGSFVPSGQSGDPSPLELGVKFRSNVAGSIRGIRFYKGAGNGGQHVVNLWKTDGTKLATALSTNESTTGWQEVRFASPVSIAANTLYVASYFLPQGRWSYDLNYFNAARTNGPLTAPATTESPNGLYIYGTASAFPNNSYSGSNYWVDVVFSTTGASSSDTTPPTVSITAPAAGSAVSGPVAISASAADNGGVAGVQFRVDGSNLGSEDTSTPFSASWNSALVANGTHTITAVARDASGNTASASITVSVNNQTMSACDANGDSTTNVVDVQIGVNQALGLASCSADVNGDGACNVSDVQRIVNAALGGSCLTN